jgi:hypothetical protein
MNVDTNTNIVTCWSLNELVELSKKHRHDTDYSDDPEFTWGLNPPDGWGMEMAWDYAEQGWSELLPETLDIASHAVATVEGLTDVVAFDTLYGVAGDEVDVGRALSGNPESMVSYPLTEIPQAGRVITLVAGVCYSASIGAEQIKARGRCMVALALALSNLGYGVELWADVVIGRDPQKQGTLRTLIKGARDILDPSKVMFAIAHPAMLRCVAFGAGGALPNAEKLRGRMMWGLNGPGDSPRTLPEGTVYLDGIFSTSGMPDPVETVMSVLRDLGIV